VGRARVRESKNLKRITPKPQLHLHGDKLLTEEYLNKSYVDLGSKNMLTEEYLNKSYLDLGSKNANGL
jgi:hypothetical protein